MLHRQTRTPRLTPVYVTPSDPHTPSDTCICYTVRPAHLVWHLYMLHRRTRTPRLTPVSVIKK